MGELIGQRNTHIIAFKQYKIDYNALNRTLKSEEHELNQNSWAMGCSQTDKHTISLLK